MITVRNDDQVSGMDTAIEISSDLPPLAPFRAIVTPEEWRQFIKQIRSGDGDLDHANKVKWESWR